MATPSRLFLIGPMGVGKTTIGKQLAERLELPFRDSDHELERRTGVDIATIFDIEGEEGFRRREEAMIAALTSLERVVLATGGGVILNDANCQCLTDRGTVIYLRAPVAKLYRRTQGNRKRPLLQTDDPRQTLTELLQQREPLYSKIADITINTGKHPIYNSVNKVLEQLERMEKR